MYETTDKIFFEYMAYWDNNIHCYNYSTRKITKVIKSSLLFLFSYGSASVDCRGSYLLSHPNFTVESHLLPIIVSLACSQSQVAVGVLLVADCLRWVG